MQDFDELPKSIKKAIRYIKQEATQEQLKSIKIMVDHAFEIRGKKFNRLKV